MRVMLMCSDCMTVMGLDFGNHDLRRQGFHVARDVFEARRRV